MLTKEKRELIKALTQQGVPAPKVAEVVGCGTTSVYLLRRKLGIQGTKVNRIEKQIIEKLNAGARASDIADELKCSISTIYKAAKSPDCNWPCRYIRRDNEDKEYRKTEIRKLLGMGWEQARIGRIFGISRERVRQIIEEQNEQPIQPELAERNTVNDAGG